MRLLDEILEALGEPVIAPGLLGLALHPLLHHHPFAVIGDDESMQIKLESILQRGTVYLGDKPAGGCQRGAVKTDAVADCQKFLGGFPRMPAASAADMEAEFARERTQPLL